LHRFLSLSLSLSPLFVLWALTTHTARALHLLPMQR
jgi:hypothetical protein